MRPSTCALLTMLPAATGGFVVSQHTFDPHPDQWFAGWNASDVGPFSTAEEALAGGIKWLKQRYTESHEERQLATNEVLRLEDELARLKSDRPNNDDVPPEWRKAFDG